MSSDPLNNISLNPESAEYVRNLTKHHTKLLFAPLECFFSHHMAFMIAFFLNFQAEKLVQLLKNRPVEAQLEAFSRQLARFQSSVDEGTPERLQSVLSVFESVSERLGIEEEYGEWFVRTFTNSDDFGSGVDGVPLTRCPCANCDEESASGCPEEGKFRCSICGLAKYCGSACQREHWPTHKVRKTNKVT